MKNETYCWLVLRGIFFFFFQLSCESYMVMDVVVQNTQKSSGYDQGTTVRKKHVSRDSKMCCCCCRFCCGAPTADERTHAPVLHDASQIDYCRYWGRASLPPITSNTVFGLKYVILYYFHKPENRGHPSSTCFEVFAYTLLKKWNCKSVMRYQTWASGEGDETKKGDCWRKLWNHPPEKWRTIEERSSIPKNVPTHTRAYTYS